MWREARFRTFFSATHEEYLNEPYQRSVWMTELADMERELANRE